MDVQVTEKDAENIGNLLSFFKDSNLTIKGKDSITVFYALDGVYNLRERIILANKGGIKPDAVVVNNKSETKSKKKNKKNKMEIKEEVHGNID